MGTPILTAIRLALRPEKHQIKAMRPDGVRTRVVLLVNKFEYN
jgi:hypothetical protein